MILSFHPCFVGNKNITCAGRQPNDEDLNAIKAATAVILPQGCTASLYEMAQSNCPNVFPNYTVRFKFRDKIGQVHLFRETLTPHPVTLTYENLSAFVADPNQWPISNRKEYPFVFKFDWGGEGKTVFLIRAYREFESVLEKADRFEKSGQSGFLLQEFIPSQNRSLRVVVINEEIITYWRHQPNAENFGTALSRGAEIDAGSDPSLQKKAALLVKDFCQKTEINLAGIDLLYSPQAKSFFFLEINYFFGRRGLGGSEKYYAFLRKQIRKWLADNGLTIKR